MPYFVGGEVDDVDELIARSPEEHRRNGIDVRLRHEVVAIDLDARTVTVRDLDSTAPSTSKPFDQLVIATGADAGSPRRCPASTRAACTACRRSPTASTLRRRRRRRARPRGRGRRRRLRRARDGRGAAQSAACTVTVVEAATATDVDARPRHGRARRRRDPRASASSCTPTPRSTAFETDADGHVRAVVTGERHAPGRHRRARASA